MNQPQHFYPVGSGLGFKYKMSVLSTALGSVESIIGKQECRFVDKIE